MVFPHNVDNEIRKASTMSGSGKAQLGSVAAGIACLVLYFFMKYIFISLLELPKGVMLLAYGLSVLIIFIYVFRFVIFKEQEKKVQAKNANSETLAKYINVNKDSCSYVEVLGLKIPILEFDNGNNFVVIEFKFGENSDQKAAVSSTMLYEVIRLLNANYLEYRFYVMKESFENSEECAKMMNSFNNVQDPQLAYYLLQIANEALKLTTEESNVDSIILQIRATNSLQALALRDNLKPLVSLLNSMNTAFRSIKFLDINDTFELVKLQDHVAALDFALMTNMLTLEEGNSVDDSSGIVSLLSLKAETGQIFDVESKLQEKFELKARPLK